MICSLLLALAIALSVTVYFEERRSSLAGARERLRYATAQLSGLLRASASQTLQQALGLAKRPVVTGFFDGSTGPAGRRAAQRFLDSVVAQARTTVVAELWAADGSVALSSGVSTPSEPSWVSDLLRTLGSDSAIVGPFQRLQNALTYPILASVRRGDATMGYLVQRRRLVDSAQPLRDLIGSDAGIYLGNVRGDLWTDLAKPVPPPPVGIDTTGAMLQYQRESGGWQVAAAAAIPRTVWVVLVEFPRDTLLAAPLSVLRKTGAIIAGFLLLAWAGAWLVTRRFTKPLADLSRAAEAIAGGDYSHRITVGRADELGQLGQAFNAMARSVGTAIGHFQSALESSPIGRVMVDRSGAIVLVNAELERLFGYARGELLGKPVELLVPQQVRNRHPSLRMGFWRDPRTRSMGAGRDLYGVRKDGSEFPVEIGLTPVEGDEGPLVLAYVADISERKQAEAALRASEAHMRTVLENIEDGVLLLDQQGHVLDANPRACELTGYSKEQLLQTTTADTYRPEERATAAARLAQVVAGVPISVEREMVRKDGSVIIIESEAKLLPNGRVLATIRDITESKRLTEQLLQAQKMEAVGRLAGGVAHDFNNILTAIFGYADLLAEQLPPEGTARADVDEIRTAASRAAALTRQLLAFSRQQVLQPAVLNINGVVKNLEKMLHRILGEDVELRAVLAPDLGNVKADPGHIEQVILNLAVNARDAMPTGGKLTIETANANLDETYARTHHAVIPERYVMLAVSDTGIGMDETTKARIFEPFFTTKEKGKGTGLGLATVHGIVNQSGGHVWVYSEPGQGSTFKVYLPRVDAPVEAAALLVGAPTVGGKETLLLAEDDDLLRPLSKALLSKLGYRVLEAKNATGAVAAARNHAGEIHLLVSDVVMPGQSGLQLARQLLETRPSMRVLYMSGYTDEAIVRHGLLERGLNYLQKPFTPAALAQKVREVLDAAPVPQPPSP